MKDQQNGERMIFGLVFALLFSLFYRLLPFGGMNRILIGTLLGGFGAIIGGLLYKLVAHRNNVLKYGSLVVAAMAVLGFFYFMASYYRKEEQKRPNPMEVLVKALTPDAKDVFDKPMGIERKIPELTKEQKARLITCEICGYKALDPDSTKCYNCSYSIFDTNIYEPNRKAQWLIDQQIMWFFPDEKTGKVDFYGPKEMHGFRKASSWKPNATEAEVVEFNK